VTDKMSVFIMIAACNRPYGRFATWVNMTSLLGLRHLRSAVRGQLAVPRYRLTTAGRRPFSFAGPSAWNSLPTYL